ncbi:MAG: imidazole glycerol phosphate synthase subunit HisH [Planctomycetota bacterium]
MTAGPRIGIVPTGVANTASVAAALRRCGATPGFAEDASAVEAAACLVLPGVGSFAAGMDSLRDRGLVDAIAARVRDGRPTLAICLGMQMLCTASDESPGVRGLGVIDAAVERFTDGVCVPQFGWNRVAADPSGALLREGYAYFANSFRLADAPDGWRCATAEHGGSFVAAMERDGVLACQFHPELSSGYGLGILARWLAAAGVEAAC